MMNRAQRRNLKRVVAHAIKGKPGLAHPVPDSVVLRGGPMDGWIVKPDAPALEADWRAKYLEETAHRLYEQDRSPGGEDRSVEWEELADEGRKPYRWRARHQYGAGHYELRGKGQAEWVVEP